MKKSLLLFIGLLVGGGATYFYFQNRLSNSESLLVKCENENRILRAVSEELQDDFKISLKNLAPPDSFVITPQPLPAAIAHKYHQNYINGTPVLKTRVHDANGNIGDQNIRMFTIEAKSIRNIQDAAGQDFAGIALIPGLITEDIKGVQKGHTLIMVGYKLDDKGGKYLILPNDDQDTTFIEDHLDVCPDICVTNEKRLTSANKPWSNIK
ncbi:hypothetical protein G3O08_09060 [Cryomorpha ignava]|uniref:Uncharacterized protein n=1 Tax=Cryomorpha ignava TaxID=101383 RepID=A0A7K3WPR5_9FLAO|nr:hypothetical protein [Cryomorpha ignava]NEN23650.1 hypothetical protein [Cryomorpha ignava]